jgi:hypothetical protein
MIQYLIHLETEYYEPKPHEKIASIAEGITANNQAAQKAFAGAIKEQAALFSLVEKEYHGPTLTTAIIVDILDDKLDEALALFRAMDEVKTIEPYWETPAPEKSTTKAKMEDFLK